MDDNVMDMFRRCNFGPDSYPRVPHGPKLDAALTKPNVNATVKPALCGLVSRPLSHVANLKLTYVYFQYFYNLHGPGSSISIVRKRNQLFLPKTDCLKRLIPGYSLDEYRHLHDENWLYISVNTWLKWKFKLTNSFSHLTK